MKSSYFIGFYVHKIRGNEFKSIVTLNRLMDAWDREETGEDEMKAAQTGVKQLHRNFGLCYWTRGCKQNSKLSILNV